MNPMNKNQKTFLFVLAIIVMVSLFLSIIYTVFTTQVASNKLKVVTSFYPITYLTQQIGGDYIEITQLMPNNGEVHSWEPSISHIMAAEDANIIFYNGADADHWMEENVLPVLSSTNNKNRVIVETTSNLTLITNIGQEHREDQHKHELYDPHTWISPYMAKQQAEKIYNTLIIVDSQHENYYTQKWNKLQQQLEQLDGAYLNGLSNTNKNTIFVSHEAYGYLTNRYGFTQHGAIGLSADQQPSVTSISQLINELKEYQTHILYFDPVYSDKYIQTIKYDLQTKTGQNVTILKLYLMVGPIDDLDYIEQMQTNLINLQTGLEAL
ncbi:MAG: zinc ABC transporter substrate-binding protein [Candidatus Bathyarchaeota archaeon]|uniref:metal ABC transporter substrate-binding protein n=2 Tax=Candidatus Bathycorpusculum sp. TaxID=2994959 RepID=UPI002822578C|nr:zinc ABC transporter substrate-binding protein [Candidatus Termiticorpusculum sp.]